MRHPQAVHIVRAALSFLVLLPSCGETKGPPGLQNPPTPPPLEQVPHSELGNVRVVFERLSADGGVYWVDGGSGSTGAGFGGGVVTDPSISPDGRRLAYRSPTSFATAYDVYVADLPDGSQRQLSSESGNSERAPTWTAAGAVVWGSSVYPARFLRHATGSAQVETVATLPALEPNQLCPYYAPFDGPPSVAQSGELLFVCQGRALYRIVPGGQPVLIHAQPDSGNDAIRHAAWSPTGDRVAFLSHRTAQNAGPGYVRVYVLDAAGGAPVLMTERVIPAGSAEFGNAPHLTLCWAGSSRIVFAAPTGNLTAHIFAVPVSGGTAVQVTSAAGVADGSVSCSRTAF